ncbi:MAG: dolichol kinase [Halobacteriaceae archaeon]
MGELRRRLVHATGAGIPLAYVLDGALGVNAIGWGHVQAFLVAGSTAALCLEVLRLGGVVDWTIFDRLTREYEEDNLAGYALYAFGMTVAALAFVPRVAVPAMLMLTVGDPISGLLSGGGLTKRAPVLAAMFAVCLGLALPFVAPVAAVAGAAVATAADGLKPVLWTYVIDDNLTIPIGAGAAMAAALAVL